MNAPVALSTHISGLCNYEITLSTQTGGLYNYFESKSYGLQNQYIKDINLDRQLHFRDISFGLTASFQKQQFDHGQGHQFWIDNFTSERQLGHGQRHEHFNTSAMVPVRQRNDSATNKHFGTHQLHRRSLARALLDNEDRGTLMG